MISLKIIILKCHSSGFHQSKPLNQEPPLKIIIPKCLSSSFHESKPLNQEPPLLLTAHFFARSFPNVLHWVWWTEMFLCYSLPENKTGRFNPLTNTLSQHCSLQVSEHAKFSRVPITESKHVHEQQDLLDPLCGGQ